MAKKSRVQTASEWHGLVNGDPLLEGALSLLHEAMERRRSERKYFELDETPIDALALARTILSDRHSEAELARLAIKLACRVEVMLDE